MERAAEPPRWREVLRGPLGLLTIGLLLLEVLGALETLVAVTVMPAVLRDLGHVQLYGWAFSAPALAMLATIPLGGRAVDRFGPARPLAAMLGVFAAGTVLTGTAPGIWAFLVGRLLQGAGAGAQYAVSLGTVAEAYPEDHRPRVLALFAAAWVLPGLVGPGVGGLFAQTIGWRWAFLAFLPLLALAAAMVFPALAGLHRNEPAPPSSLRWPLQLAAGGMMLLAGLSTVSVWTAPLVVAGLALGVPAMGRTFRPPDAPPSPGVPRALAAGFLLTFAFSAADGFVPLLLTGLRGRSVAEAGAVVTGATLGWAAGSWWQSRAAASRPLGGLAAAGSAVLVLGVAGVAAGLLPITLAVPYVAWAIGGLGMGIAYPTVYLATMQGASRGREGGTVAIMVLVDALGTSVGAGLAGSAVAIAHDVGAGLRVGLTAALAVAVAAGLAAATIARGMSAATATPESEADRPPSP